MKKTLRAVLALSVLSLLILPVSASPVLAFEDEDPSAVAVAPPLFQEAFWYPQVTLSNWKDYGPVRNRESGGLFGIGVTGRLPLPQGYFLKPAAEVFGGSLGYRGQFPAGDGGTDYLGIKATGDLGRSFLGPGMIGVEPFGGVGFRYWHRDIKPGNGSQLERWTTGYLRAGVRATYNVSKATRLFAEAGAIYPVFTRTSTSGLGLNAAITPDGALSGFAEIGGDVGGFRPSVFYEGFNFENTWFEESRGNNFGFRFGIPF